MSIEKSISEEFTNPGATINFTVTVKNTASGVARNVVLTDILPEGFFFKDTNLATRDWNLGDIRPGIAEKVSYEVSVSEDVKEGKYRNIAEVRASNHGLISSEALIEVRLPIVKGEEIVVPPVEREVLPHTGINPSAIFIFFSALSSLIVGVFGLIRTIGKKISLLIKQHKEAFQIALFSTIIICSLVVLIYPFWPMIYQEPQSQLTADIEIIEDKKAEKKIEIEGDYLIIPKIGVKIPIVEGKDESALDKGAWLLPESSPPNLVGNTVLAGHRFKYKPPHQETFYLLDKLEKGDVLLVFWKGKEYSYNVVSSEVVDPKAVEVLGKTSQPILTLITCHPLFSDQKRLVVIGERIQVL